jgi:hypothetical protein
VQDALVGAIAAGQLMVPIEEEFPFTSKGLEALYAKQEGGKSKGKTILRVVPKTIAVVGATGSQGSGVVDSLLAKGYHVRGLTRNVDSAKAKALAARGVEVVAAELDDKQSLVRAFAEAHGVFLVTEYQFGDSGVR